MKNADLKIEEVIKFVGLSTLKKEYSISCKDYVVMGFMNGKIVVVDLGAKRLLGEFDDPKAANDTFNYFVNKI